MKSARTFGPFMMLILKLAAPRFSGASEILHDSFVSVTDRLRFAENCGSWRPAPISSSCSDAPQAGSLCFRLSRSGS